MGFCKSIAGEVLGLDCLKEVEKWARLHDVWRLELTVMAHNTRAQALYKKLDLRKKVSKRAALIIDGENIDSMKWPNY